jgi:hypothetical protein
VPGGCAAGTKCSPDGICCDRTCSGSCEACDLPGSLGTCTTLPSGATPHSGHTACGGAGVCAGSCGGSIDGSCTYPVVACGSAGCTGLSYQAAGTCKAGACNTPAAQTCLYACSTTVGCTGECTSGSKRCNSSQPQTCDSNGAWQNTGNACSGCYTCSSATGACAPSATGTGCDDGDACTQYDSCKAGVCAGTPVTCAATTCHVAGTCSAGTCSQGSPVADGTTDLTCATSTPRCYSGSCVECVSDQHCTTSTRPSCDLASHKCVCRRPSVGNLVQNPGFDSSLVSWVQYGDVSWSDEDSEGCLGSGSVSGDNTDDEPNQCFPVPGGGIYYFGAKFKLPLSNDSTYCNLTFTTSQNCDPSGVWSSQTRIGPMNGTWNGTGWAAFSTTAQAPTGTQSGSVDCYLLSTKMDQIYVNRDDNSF